MTRYFTWSLLACLAVVGHLSAVHADDEPREIFVDQVRNHRPGFTVAIAVDHPDRTYQDGETISVKVVSQQAGYLYLFHCNSEGKTSVLFPNQLQEDNRIAADQEIQIPAPHSDFRLRVRPPLGDELLKAVVTRNQLSDAVLDRVAAEEEDKDVTVEAIAAIGQELHRQSETQWAEGHIRLKTVRRREVARAARRVGLFVGISDFEHINDLMASHNDAQVMADTMRSVGGVDEAIVLLNGQATRAAVEQALLKQLPAMTRPGDEVVVFWSGHGGQCADDSSDERDGLDEFLVPYDGRSGDIETARRTMLLDDTLGRWIQELDMRKVVVILDVCFAGGAASDEKRAKSISSASEGRKAPRRAAEGQPEIDFLDSELAWLAEKDIGQRNSAILASSSRSEVSFERREKDLSVMTYFLVDQLKNAPDRLTLKDAYARLTRLVPEYVAREFPGATQSPQLMDLFEKDFLIRP